MKSIAVFITFFSISTLLHAAIPAVPKSVSPNGMIHAVIDIDRDPKISPEWKGDSFPKVEITERASGRVLVSFVYFGAVGDDKRPLREHIHMSWRSDSKAFSITINDRFYSSSTVYIQNGAEQFISVPFPTSYEDMTGFPTPDTKHLRPRGRDIVLGWDKQGRLMYSIFRVPLPTFTGNDPLIHKVFLEVTPAKMTPVKVEHETGKWRRGDWIIDTAEQDAAPNH